MRKKRIVRTRINLSRKKKSILDEGGLSKGDENVGDVEFKDGRKVKVKIRKETLFNLNTL